MGFAQAISIALDYLPEHSQSSELRDESCGQETLQGSLCFQVLCDAGEEPQGGLEVVRDFLREYVGLGEILGVFKAFVFEPEDVEIDFVAFDQLVVVE